MTATIQDRDQTRSEELANSISHGIGLLTALVAAPFMILHTIQGGDTETVVGSSIFVVTIIFLYLTSTIYHALPIGYAKRLFRVIEHSAIFLLIAGTYTPFMLTVLHGALGLTLLSLIWCIAISGITLKFFYRMAYPVASTILYVFMGWLVLIAIKPLYDSMPTIGLLWIVAGGIAYTIGVAFYVADSQLRYGHFIWHLFVIAGTTCHYIAVLEYATR